MSENMDWNLIWTPIGAIATTIAIIVALWQTKFNYKKKLKLTFTDNIVIVPENGSFFRNMWELWLQI